MCESAAMTVNCHVFNGNTWTESTAQWSNVAPDGFGTLLDSKTVSYNTGNALTPTHRYSFDILQAVRGWKNGTYSKDKGILFKAPEVTETADTYLSKTFASYNRASNKPSLTVTYTIAPTSVSISPNAASAIKGARYSGLVATVLPVNSSDDTVVWASSNSNIASIDSNTGEVTAVSTGVAKITCKTNDGNISSSNSCLFTVNPDSASYTTMSLDVNYSRTLFAGKHFWFKFTPSETGTYTFESSGSVDTYGVLYQGDTLLHSDDDDGNNRNFKLSYRLIAGTQYRFLVKGYSDNQNGAFSFKVIKGWIEMSRPNINSRSSWGARDPIQNRLVDRTRNPQRIIFHHSADKFSSQNDEDIKAEIRRIQNMHMDDRGKCDIAYHFIIDPNGTIWEGAQIDAYQRGHATGYFDDIGVLILGDFEPRIANLEMPNTLNQNQKNAMELISRWLCYEYNLSIIPSGQNAAPINTHRGVDSNTVCPGANAAPWIENELRYMINHSRL